MKGISSIQRLSRDISELFASDFNCTASHLYVKQTGDSLNELGAISLESHVFEGPYRGGRFHFCFHISGNYPFKPVEIWATQPIWHPNIDIRTGKVALPLEWSPVLTLHALALAVQVQKPLSDSLIFTFPFLSFLFPHLLSSPLLSAPLSSFLSDALIGTKCRKSFKSGIVFVLHL